MAFYGEERAGGGGRTIRWPRVVRASGREATDFVKPALCLSLIGGSLSLVGPPPLYSAEAAAREGVIGEVRPGITGRWRLVRQGSRERALEEEALGLESWSTGRDVVIVMESIVLLCSGSYPGWFFTKGDAT